MWFIEYCKKTERNKEFYSPVTLQNTHKTYNRETNNKKNIALEVSKCSATFPGLLVKGLDIGDIGDIDAAVP